MAVAQGNTLDPPPPYGDLPPSYDEVMNKDSQKSTPHDDGKLWSNLLLLSYLFVNYFGILGAKSQIEGWEV